MTKFKLLSAVAAATLSISGVAATTAAAQPWRAEYTDSRLSQDYLRHLGWKVDNAENRGMISRGQASELRAELRSVLRPAWEAQMGRPVSPWEINRLRNVINHVDSVTSGYAYNTYRPYPYWRR